MQIDNLSMNPADLSDTCVASCRKATNPQQAKVAIVIPVYNHAKSVRDVVETAKKLGFPVLVVDDGATDATYERLKDIEDIQILRHEVNRGKGAALLSGFAEASRIADWAITLDADGQHDPMDAKKLIQAIHPSGERVIIIGQGRA